MHFSGFIILPWAPVLLIIHFDYKFCQDHVNKAIIVTTDILAMLNICVFELCRFFVVSNNILLLISIFHNDPRDPVLWG